MSLLSGDVPASDSGVSVRHIITEIYRSALQLQGPLPEASLEELGGDSLTAMTILLKVQHAFPAIADEPELLADIAQLPRAAALATTVSRLCHRVGGTTHASLAVRPVNRAEPASSGVDTIPLLPDQIWFLDEAHALLTDPARWGVTARTVALPGGWRAAATTEAFGDVWCRHPALRAHFVEASDGWRQKSRPASAPPPVVTRRLETPAQWPHPATEVITELRAGLDIRRGPLVGFGLLLDRADNARYAVLVAHHLVCDLMSTNVIWADLARFHDARASGAGQRVEVDDSITTYATALHHHAAAEPLRAETREWLDLPWHMFRRLPIDLAPPGANTVSSRRTVRQHLDVSVRAIASALPMACTPRDLMLAALGAALTPFTGGPTAVKTVHNGRLMLPPVGAAVARIVGRLATSGVVVLPGFAGGSPARYLAAVSGETGRMPRDGVGYSLARWLGAPEAIRTTVEARWRNEVLVNYVGGWRPTAGAPALTEVHSPHLRVGGEPPDHPRFTKIDVSLHAVPDGLVIEWAYSDQLHREATIRRLHEDFIAFLTGLRTG